MVKATLRTATTKPTHTVIDAEVVVEGVKVPTTSTVAPAAGLEDTLLGDAQADAPGKPVNSTATTSVTRRPSMTVDRAREYAESGFEGDWDATDLKFPQLKQVQGSGPLSHEFDNGTIIYADVELLPAPSVKADAVNPSIRFVPISLTKQFREKLSEEAVQEGQMPRIFNTIHEVEEAGLTTVWVGNSMPENYAEPSAKCFFLLEKPESSDHAGFSLELDGKQYGVAVYYAAGGSFRDSAKIIFNAAQTALRVPVLDEAGQPRKTADGHIIKKVLLYKNYWTLNFAKKKAGNFSPWRPVVKLTRDETGPEVRNYIDQLLHGVPAEASQD